MVMRHSSVHVNHVTGIVVAARGFSLLNALVGEGSRQFHARKKQVHQVCIGIYGDGQQYPGLFRRVCIGYVISAVFATQPSCVLLRINKDGLVRIEPVRAQAFLGHGHAGPVKSAPLAIIAFDPSFDKVPRHPCPLFLEIGKLRRRIGMCEQKVVIIGYYI